MTAQEMWKLYQQSSGTQTNDWDAWRFGDDPDALARLVLEGRKTATSSAYPLYAREGEPLPEAGHYSVILDSQDEAVCIIRNVRVTVVAYREITAGHAFREGEGDRTLADWRKVHEAFFSADMAASGLSFDEDMPVVCEEFEVVYPKEESL